VKTTKNCSGSTRRQRREGFDHHSCRGGLLGVFEDGILAGQTRLRGDNGEASTPLSSHSRMARSNFPVLGQCSESCCHRLEISLATFRPCVVGSSARICTASSRAYLRQDKFEPLCCDSPFPLAQENSAREARHYCNIAIRECLICDVQRWIAPVRYANKS
jgi:hypothetical protein